MRAIVAVLATLLLASCAYTPGDMIASGGVDCRVAPDPYVCVQNQRERSERREAERIRWERERRAVDNPDSLFPSHEDDDDVVKNP